MPRTGLLVVLAILLIAGAAGVLVYTNFLGATKLDGTPANPSQTATSQAPASAQQLVEYMKEQASKGAYSATFSEKDMIKWVLAPGHRLERFTLQSADAAFARLTSTTPLDLTSPNWLTLGLSLPIPLPYAELYNGKTLEIGIVARTAQANGSPAFAAVYATQQSGNSGWQKIPVGADFSLIQLKYEVPKLEAGYTNPPIIVLHSDPSAQGGAVEIMGIYVKVLN